MAKVTKYDLVKHCESMLGTPYVFGAKGEIMTQARINSLAASYPGTFTSTYICKAQKFIGRKCLDCSGLISDKTKLIRGSSQYKSTALECVPVSKITEKQYGWGLWTQGHIGVYVGNGYAIEARGIDYGTVKTVVKNRGFVYAIKLCDIDYTDRVEKKEGWSKENGFWYWYENSQKVKNRWMEINGHWYYFGEDCKMATGWVQGKGGEWYWCDNNPDENYIGKMVTDRVIYNDGFMYYLDDKGVMAPEGKVLTFKVVTNGRLKFMKMT